MITTATKLERVPTERLEAEVQTLAGHLAAATCRWLLMIGELDRREAWRSWEVVSMAHWLSWKCGVSLVTGRDHVRVARALEQLPLVRAEFAKGRISYSKARALCRLTSAPEMEPDLVEFARVATASQLDRVASSYRKAHRFADPERDRLQHQRREWRLTIDDDGFGTLTIRAPSAVLAGIKGAVDAAVKREVPDDDGEPIAVRRVDGLEAVAQHYMQPDGEEAVATTLVMRQDASDRADSDAPSAPATLHGLPISRSAYERLRCDAQVAVERTLADGSIERSPATDAIPKPIRRAVRERDLRACRWPGCSNTSHLHVHHITYRSRNGTHSIANLVLLCSFHHHSVHDRGWTLAGSANAQLVLTAPDGRQMTEGEATDRAFAARRLALEQRRRGFDITERTIAGAYNEPLHLAWTVGNICDLEDVRSRRN